MLKGSIAELGRFHRRHVVKIDGENLAVSYYKQQVERSSIVMRLWNTSQDVLLLISSYIACLLYSDGRRAFRLNPVGRGGVPESRQAWLTDQRVIASLDTVSANFCLSLRDFGSRAPGELAGHRHGRECSRPV